MPSCTGGEIHLQRYSAQRKDVWLCFPLVTGPSNCIFLKAKRKRCLVWVPGMHTIGSRHTERSRKPNLKTALCALFCAVWLLYSCTHILKNNFWNSLFFFFWTWQCREVEEITGCCVSDNILGKSDCHLKRKLYEIVTDTERKLQ